jgi:hypothetical protein
MKKIRYDRVIAVVGLGLTMATIGGGVAVGMAYAFGAAAKAPMTIGVIIGFLLGCIVAGAAFASGDADEDMGYK